MKISRANSASVFCATIGVALFAVFIWPRTQQILVDPETLKSSNQGGERTSGRADAEVLTRYQVEDEPVSAVTLTSPASIESTPSADSSIVQNEPLPSGPSNRASGVFGMVGEYTVIDQTVRTLSDGGSIVTSLIRTSLKYPLLRVEETKGPNKRVVNQVAAAADHFVIQVKPGTQDDEVADLVGSLGLVILRNLQRPGLKIVKIPDPTIDSLPHVIERISSSEIVEYAEPDYFISPE